MSEEKKRTEVVEVEELETVSVSIDDVLEEMQRRPGEAIVSSGGRSLVGTVVETSTAGASLRALVQLDDGSDRRWVAVLRGLTVNDGDSVILSKPDNYPRWLVTGAFEAEETEAEELELDESDPLEVRVDGKRVEIEGADEIVLRCGEASITLRRNGRVVIRGTYVETRSKGTNRIKGGSVQIN